jgi:hypothetical protein
MLDGVADANLGEVASGYGGKTIQNGLCGRSIFRPRA